MEKACKRANMGFHMRCHTSVQLCHVSPVPHLNFCTTLLYQYRRQYDIAPPRRKVGMMPHRAVSPQLAQSKAAEESPALTASRTWGKGSKNACKGEGQSRRMALV